MSAKTDQRARRKEELLLLAKIERIELTQTMRDLRRLKRPLNFAMIGARIISTWRNPAWVSTAATLPAARGMDSGRIMRGLQPLAPDEARAHELDVTDGAPWRALHALLSLAPPPDVIPVQDIARINYARFRAPPKAD